MGDSKINNEEKLNNVDKEKEKLDNNNNINSNLNTENNDVETDNKSIQNQTNDNINISNSNKINSNKVISLQNSGSSIAPPLTNQSSFKFAVNTDLNSNPNQILELKLVMLGDMFVGKTSLVQQFVSNTFDANKEATVRINFVTKNLIVDNRPIKLNIWDTAGQEKYRSLAPIYFRGADAAIIVYDITRKESFEIVYYWAHQLRQSNDEKIAIGLAANKCDIEEFRKVNQQEGKDLAEQIGALCYEETSARLTTNVVKLFIQTIKHGMEYHIQQAKRKESEIADQQKSSSCC